MGEPMPDPGLTPEMLKGEGELAPILYFILIFLALFGLLFGSLIYNAANGNGGSTPTHEEEHHEF